MGSPSVQAQTTLPPLVPHCGGMFHLCGFVDRQTKNVVIPNRFERVFQFSEGLAGVRIEGRYGFIDEQGTVVIQPRFDLVGRFYQGHAEVLIGTKTGIIDRRGELVVRPQFSRSIPFTSDTVLVVEGEWRRVHYEGFEKLELTDRDLLRERFGLYHMRTGWVRKPQFYLEHFEAEGRGLIWASEVKGNKGPFGLLAADGRWKVEPQFDHVQRLSDERAIVAKTVEISTGTTWPAKERHWGAVDPEGTLVVPLKFEWLGSWRDGFGLVRKGGRKGIVDKAGNVVGGRFFDRVVREFPEGLVRVQVDGMWRGIDRSGRIVADPAEGKVISSCSDGVKVRYRSGKYEVVDASDRRTVPYLLDRGPHRLPCDRPSPVKYKGKWGYIDAEGRLLADPPSFDNVHGFVGEHGVVQIGGKWGIINTQGKFTLEPQVDRIIPSSRYPGFFQVIDSDRGNWIGATGQVRSIRHLQRERVLACAGKAKLISRNGRWGIAAADGREVIAPAYRAINCFRQGVAWAAVDAKRKWCPVGPDGSVRNRPTCKSTYYPFTLTHSSPASFSSDPYESSVRWTRAYLEFGAGRLDTLPRMIGRGGRSSTIIP
ncbi:MAG: WG repeat-containing protein [Hyphomicrobiales bacterium]|nr:WG repeat-containing protein [Hyphomicrobiales bacterium]